LGPATRVRKSNASLGACAITGPFAFFALFAVETLLTATAADGQSAAGSSSGMGGKARKIEPQKSQITQMGLCRAGLRRRPGQVLRDSVALNSPGGNAEKYK
jgi:hypothetical protein